MFMFSVLNGNTLFGQHWFFICFVIILPEALADTNPNPDTFLTPVPIGHSVIHYHYQIKMSLSSTLVYA